MTWHKILLLILSFKTPKYSVYFHIIQRKGATPQNLREAGVKECLAFLLEK